MNLVSILKNGNPTIVKPKTQSDSEIIKSNKDTAQYAAGIRGKIGMNNVNRSLALTFYQI